MEKIVVSSTHVYVMEMEMCLKMLCYCKLCVKLDLFIGKTVYWNKQIKKKYIKINERGGKLMLKKKEWKKFRE
jgi:hypothetical protein